ncbi:class I SAM-dependent methyltransferase [Nocardia iowensis]|uniref:class I SAM-dependent methyltransferase n=1 Tax=Nocardia iowensis TaxID=204891 RepID=UPI001FECA736|nr:class I SAM-dependent methyltransferase [Nocardia iowensis]
MSDDPYWNHNTHYHPWLLAQAPDSARTVLDIGCGDGLLARKFGRRGLTVHGVDLDPVILDTAAPATNVTVEQADFLDLPGTFDLVTAVASLHHVPLKDGLTALHRLVAPGGTLAVVGLWRFDIRTDFPYLALLPGIWAFDTLHRPKLSGPDAHLRDPEDTYPEIRAAAAEILPGARLRRRALLRYTLLWHKPATPPAGRGLAEIKS